MSVVRPLPALAALVLLSTVSAGAAGAQAAAIRDSDVPQVVVTGYGEVAVAPDRATIDVAVETRAANAAAAAAQNARRLRAVLDTLRARGVPAGELATIGYSVHPDYEAPVRGTPPARRGYVATNVVRIETRRLDQVGALLDAALAAGANRVNEVRFSSTRHAAVRDSATTLAIGNARQTAEAMARASGGRLGALIELSTDVNPYAMRMNVAAARAMGGAAGYGNQSTTISPDELNVGALVMTRWRFEAGP